MNSIRTVGIAGAGAMGAGIAYCSAIAGYDVLLFDTRRDALDKGLLYIRKELEKAQAKGKLSEAEVQASLQRIRLCEKADDLVADLIIEAVIEKLEVKQDLFRTLEKVNSRQAILSTNTSSIPVTRIAAALEYPDRFAGIHFFNPAHLMRLVEVIAGARTNHETIEKSRAFAESLGKTVVIAQDAPGFIVNRVARHYYVEALKIMEEDVAGFEAIDRLMESSGFRMGPFRLMDLIGVDTNYSVTESMYNLFSQDGKFRPSRIQKQKVDAGLHGRKTGEGFYRYEP